MELVVTLRKRDMLDKLAPLVDGIIVGKFFTTGFNYTLDEIKEINDYCKNHNRKIYIVLDDFISENDKEQLVNYLHFIKDLNVDGIYFHDLGVYDAAKMYSLNNKLIYDGKTVLCNSLDTAYMLKKVDSVVISRELTLEEINTIVRNNQGKVDLQIFGHVRLSYSKRKFLKNYFKEINKEYDYLNKETLTIAEEQRDYRFPIMETADGTYIYSDYIFEMMSEIVDIKPYIKRGIIDTLFIDDNIVIQACRNYRRITSENKEFLKHNLLHNYPENYSNGYFYLKTNITKDE